MTKHKLLLVDDQQSNLSMLRLHLRDYDLVEADSGRSALRKVAEEKPDLILLDVMMPGVDGYSVLSILKKSEGTRAIPVILLTSLSGMEDRIKSLEKGADDFLSKPFHPLELRARVKSLLRIKSLYNELENVPKLLISMSQALENRDPITANHSKRVAFYAEMLAKKIIPTKYGQKLVRTAGFLHDIGKIEIKESLLAMPGKLDPATYAIIKTHPVSGEEICSALSKLKPILPYIRHHHEHYDGSGYPDGLKGSDIPLEARILAIADAYDALTSERRYRKAYTQTEAVEILEANAGTQWDPHLVPEFCQMLQDESVLLEQMVWELSDKRA